MTSLIFLLALLLLPQSVEAQCTPPQGQDITGGLRNLYTCVANENVPAPGDRAFGILRIVIVALFSLLSLAAVTALIYAGFLYLTSLGEPDKAQKAKTVALYAIIGVLLVAGSFTLLRFITDFLTAQ